MRMNMCTRFFDGLKFRTTSVKLKKLSVDNMKQDKVTDYSEDEW